MEKLARLVKELSELTLLEVKDLVSSLEEAWGVSAAAPMMMAGVSAEKSDGGDAKEEKTEFDVILEDGGANKINLIKEIRALTGLGLKEAKDASENIGGALKKGTTKEDAENMKKKLEEVGAKVKIV